MLTNNTFFQVALMAVAWSAGWALAQEVQDAPTEPLAFGTPMQAEQLEGYRGGFDRVKNDAQLNGTVADNSAVNVWSGFNSIADGAFSNASGLPMVIQNSGSNVLIQNATVVNVQLQ